MNALLNYIFGWDQPHQLFESNLISMKSISRLSTQFHFARNIGQNVEIQNESSHSILLAGFKENFKSWIQNFLQFEFSSSNCLNFLVEISSGSKTTISNTEAPMVALFYKPNSNSSSEALRVLNFRSKLMQGAVVTIIDKDLKQSLSIQQNNQPLETSDSFSSENTETRFGILTEETFQTFDTFEQFEIECELLDQQRSFYLPVSSELLM